jgi:hypothetical protein
LQQQQQQLQQQQNKPTGVTFSANSEIQRVKRPATLTKPSTSVLKSTSSSANANNTSSNYNRFKQQGPPVLNKTPVSKFSSTSSKSAVDDDFFPPPPPIPIHQMPHQHSHLQTSLNQPSQPTAILLQDYQEPNNLSKSSYSLGGKQQPFSNVEDEFKKKVCPFERI